MDKDNVAMETQPLLSNSQDGGRGAHNGRKYCRSSFVAAVSVVSVVCMALAGSVLYFNSGGSSGNQSHDAVLTLTAGAVRKAKDECVEKYTELTQEQLSLLELSVSALPHNTTPPYTPVEEAWMLKDVLPQQQHNPQRRRRREVRTLTSDQWRQFTQAVRAMASTYPEPGSRSEYHLMVAAHSLGISPYAHFGPSFLPWHRVYLDKFESALTAHAPDVALPYWDTVLESSLPDYRDSVIWTPQLFGSSTGEVNTGPFAGHENLPGYCTQLFGKTIQRDVISQEVAVKNLLTRPVIDNALLNRQSYEALMHPAIVNYTEDASGLIELYHGGVHASVGGTLANVPCSPGDPIFFLWHNSLDEIFEEFRQESQITNPENDYYYEDGMDPGYKPDAPLYPFQNLGLTNIWGLSSHFTSHRYEYATRPSKRACAAEVDCDSPVGYLWCSDCHMCVSKVREGGNCTGLPDRACYCGNQVPVCMDNTCYCLP